MPLRVKTRSLLFGKFDEDDMRYYINFDPADLEGEYFGNPSQ